MKKSTFISVGLLSLSLIGCSQIPSTVATGNQVQVDKEPEIVGVPFSQRVNQTSQNINDQLDLLKKVKSQEFVGKFEMVQHNNDLDARKNSDRTIPQAYSKMEDKVGIKQEEIDSPFNKKIKNLEWENNSSNELGKMLADSIGYSFASNSKDAIVTLKLKNTSVGKAIEELKVALGKKAEVIVTDKNKTLSIIYK